MVLNNNWTLDYKKGKKSYKSKRFFTESAPLGRFSHGVAMSVRVCVVVWFCAIGSQASKGGPRTLLFKPKSAQKHIQCLNLGALS